jgi:alpha-glucosidase
MQWSAAPQAGFSTGRPWLPPSPDYERVNVAAQRQDQKSMLWLYKRLIALRQAEPALQIGTFERVETSSDVLTYVRGATFLVALNLGPRPRRVSLRPNGTVVLSTYLDRENERLGNIVALRPDEGLIVRL